MVQTQELNHIDGLVVMERGVRIVSGGFNLGAVGVSGAPSGTRNKGRTLHCSDFQDSNSKKEDQRICKANSSY